MRQKIVGVKSHHGSRLEAKTPSFTGDQLTFLIENAHLADKKGKTTKFINKGRSPTNIALKARATIRKKLTSFIE